MYTSQSDAKFNLLLAELPVALRTAVERNRLCNPRILRWYPRMTVSTGVSSVPESAWSTVTDPATSTPLIPTCTDVSMDPEDAEGCKVLPNKIQEGVERLTGVVVEGNVKSS